METKDQLLALIDANGGDDHVIGIQFDNSIFGYFDTDDTKFDRSKNIETINGVDYVVMPYMMYSKPRGERTIAMKSYHPIGMIQVMQFVEDVGKRPYIQTNRFIQERGL